jgi:hypothetical protein
LAGTVYSVFQSHDFARGIILILVGVLFAPVGNMRAMAEETTVTLRSKKVSLGDGDRVMESRPDGLFLVRLDAARSEWRVNTNGGKLAAFTSRDIGEVVLARWMNSLFAVI